MATSSILQPQKVCCVPTKPCWQRFYCTKYIEWSYGLRLESNIDLTIALVVHASVPSNTFAIYGNGEDKELTELVPGILNQLGPDSLASLRKLAESYQSMQQKEGGEEGDKKGEDDDDDIPDLVAGETFDSKVE